MNNIIEQLTEVLTSRKQVSPDSSYVAQLHNKGIDHILKKIGEESAEVLTAAKTLEYDNSQSHQDAVVYEMADLWFHSMVMLSHFDLEPMDVLKELERRFNLSGLEEKAARG